MIKEIVLNQWHWSPATCLYINSNLIETDARIIKTDTSHIVNNSNVRFNFLLNLEDSLQS